MRKSENPDTNIDNQSLFLYDLLMNEGDNSGRITFPPDDVPKLKKEPEETITLRRSIISAIRQRRTNEHPTKNPYDLTFQAHQRSIDLACAILGEEHALPTYMKKGVDERVKGYVDCTGLLLDDAFHRWGSDMNPASLPHNTLLQNIVDFDRNRMEFLTILEHSLLSLISGEWEDEGQVTVPYQFEQSDEVLSYPFEKSFAAVCLEFQTHQNQNNQHVAYKDPRVPFLYLSIQDPNFPQTIISEPHREKIFDTFSSLVNNEPIECKDKHGENHAITLSQEARDELGKCGCLVLNPLQRCYTAQNLQTKDDKGVMLVPAPFLRDYPRRNDYLFREVGKIEHEMRHLSDIRIYDKNSFSSSLLELRAFATQRSCYERYRQHDLVKGTTHYLSSYVHILEGQPTETHIEEYYRDSISELLFQLSPDQLKLVANALSA